MHTESITATRRRLDAEHHPDDLHAELYAADHAALVQELAALERECRDRVRHAQEGLVDVAAALERARQLRQRLCHVAHVQEVQP